MAEQYRIGDRSFRTKADYALALADQKKIETLRKTRKLDEIKEIDRLLLEMRGGRVLFRSILGEDFREELEERKKELAENAQAKTKKGSKNTLKIGKSVSEKTSGKINEKNVKKSKKSEAKFGKKPEAPVKSLDEYDDKMRAEILKELKKREKRRRLFVALCRVRCKIIHKLILSDA